LRRRKNQKEGQEDMFKSIPILKSNKAQMSWSRELARSGAPRKLVRFQIDPKCLFPESPPGSF
jgi:hypothetical protein